MSRIAFVNLDGQLEIIAPDGSDRQRLTDDTYFYHFPAFSPDGRTLAVLANSQEEGFVIVFDLSEDVGRLRKLYRSETRQPFYVYWSPNSRRLGFLSTHDRGGVGLHTVLSTGGPSQFLGMGQPFFWVWRPGGDELLIHAGWGKEARLAFLNLANMSATYEAQNIAPPGHFQAPGISPSGRYYAYAMIDAEDHSHIVIEKEEGRRRLTYRHQGAVVLSWSPQADLLATISSSEISPQFFGPLQLIDPGTRRVRRLTEETVLAFFWSPDGRSIAYLTAVQVGRPGEAERVAGGYARGRRLPDEITFNLWLNLNVVNITTGEKRLLTPFKPGTLFLKQLLPFFDQYALSHRVWSPASDALLLPAVIDHRETLVIVPLSGLPPLPLAPATIGFWSPV